MLIVRSISTFILIVAATSSVACQAETNTDPGAAGQACNYAAAGTDGCDAASVCVSGRCLAMCLSDSECSGSARCSEYMASNGVSTSICQVAPTPSSTSGDDDYLANGCPRDYPVACGGRLCCPSRFPVCGGSCGSECCAATSSSSGTSGCAGGCPSGAVCVTESGSSSCRSTCTSNSGCSTNCCGSLSGTSVRACVSSGYCSSSTGGGTSTGGGLCASSTAVAGGSLNGCVQQFYDPSFYNWLSFRNTCSQAIHVSYCRKNAPSNCYAKDVAPGGSSSTGFSQSEVNAFGGFSLAVCSSDRKAWTTSGSWTAGQPFCCIR
jgi:hypothetical protein